MTSKKPLVIVTRKLPEVTEARMAELFRVRLNDSDHPMSRQELIAAIREADILVPTVTDRIDFGVLSEAGAQLKLIANFGMGVDHIDLAAARARNIIVTHTPDVLTEDTADMTMAMMLALPRRLIEGERLVRENAWEGWAPTTMLGQRVWGKRLGIVGMGRIGQAVARRAKAFGMAIHYYSREKISPQAEEALEATCWDSLDQMLARMDIISIHCPHTPATFHLLSARRLALLQPHCYLINTARGEIVDEAALIRLLVQKKIAGAALDVFENEPAISPKLLSLDNVLLLPHMGSATTEARLETGERLLINIKAFVDGYTPPNRVLASMF